ncbi:MAG: hypothetical protein IJS14_05280 [Lentisphaeria bacterium]|nr:hypothetical protein [Lentisphaeria bacterium]
MFRKLFVFAAVMLTAVSLYAQKPVAAAVTDIVDDPGNGLEMCRSLFNEYFLSELTTHVKVTVLDTASVQKAINEMQLSRGIELTDKQIAELCDKLKTDALCLVKMARGNKKNAVAVTVDVVSRDGKKLGQVSASMKGIGDTDATSHAMAGKCAVILRKIRGIDEKEVKKEEKAANVKDKQVESLPSTVTGI